MRGVTRTLLVLAVAVAVVGGGYLWFLRAVAGPGPLQTSTTVIIAPGSGLSAIAQQLVDAEIVRAAWMFEIEARRLREARALKPGEYRFDAGTSLDAVMNKIVRREVVARFVTFPEGIVSADVMRILDSAEGLQGEASPPDDGDILPETYRYEWGDQRSVLLSRMRAAHAAILADLWSKRDPSVSLKTPEEALVLASIVEKETALPEERPHIAAVFLNRLHAGMRLQSDPTVSYGIGAASGPRALTRADLDRPTPFNTYLIDGLPPHPICNPGRAALLAVLHPTETDDLYFVADGSGGHAFASSLAEHNRNVSHWRHLQQHDETEPDE
jgi:UPF0755 protein